mgnify:CR=1 FL=1
MRLKDKVVIVTGAASGFGRGMAERFHAEGARLLLADLNGPGAAAVAAALGEGASSIGADVAKAADMQAVVEQALKRFGTLHAIVNNAGFTHRNRPMLEVDEATFDRVYAVNVKSIYLAAQAAVPVFRRLGSGIILNIASTAGLRPRPGLTWYNGSKGAVLTLTKSMALELAPDRIRVNAICPVIAATGMVEDFMGMPDTPANRQRFLASIPLGRFSTPADIANAALYLLSDEADFITGVALEVDGGRCA